MKKKNDDRVKELHFKIEKNDEKRSKALERFTNYNKDKDYEGYKAFGECIKEIEKRVKSNQDEEQLIEIQKYKNFKVYMTQ